MYYDQVKKRWVLRGKIYDDEPTPQPIETIKEPTSLPKPSVAIPPKISLKPTINNQIKSDNSSKPEKNKISNPFASKKETPTTNKPSNQPNLQNRYVNTIFDN
jgi:hypothetical protein